jgi:hypothetical protein
LNNKVDDNEMMIEWLRCCEEADWSAMTDERSLKAFIQRRPFRPFSVELAPPVDHPDALARRGAGSRLHYPSGSYTLFDSTGVTQLTDDGDRRSRRQAVAGGHGKQRPNHPWELRH